MLLTRIQSLRFCMAGKQAKILSDLQIAAVLRYADQTRYPARNRVIVLLSAKAGLRAGEIANLTWDMIVGPAGELATSIALRDSAAKYGGGRTIPVHLDLRAALKVLASRGRLNGPVIESERGGSMTPLSIVVWFNKAFKKVSLVGCSSHSGRRTFITRAARLIYKAGGSLRDVQILAGHRSIQTTQRYIDGDSDAQRRLVALI